MAHQAVGTMRVAPIWEPQYHFCHYTQRPLAEPPTRFDSDCTVVVMAVLAMRENQEDSLILNQAFVDRGGFTSTCVRVIVARVDLPLQYCVEPRSRVSKGAPLCKQGAGDKQLTTKYFDKEGGVVEAVRASRDSRGRLLLAFKIRKLRRVQDGDKFSSRYGQKGTVGRTYAPEDLPFTSSGMVPDMIINPHAFPSRMTIGQLIEMLCGKVSCYTGKAMGAEAFEPVDLASLQRAMLALGFKQDGTEQFTCGMTGEVIRAPVFVGPVAYMKLRHQVEGKAQVRGAGAMVDSSTRQPVHGRSKDGGTRFGEMEFSSVWAHGATSFAQERATVASDGVRALYCSHCGAPAYERLGFYFCPECNSDNVQIKQENTSYATLVSELRAMGVAFRYT